MRDGRDRVRHTKRQTLRDMQTETRGHTVRDRVRHRETETCRERHAECGRHRERQKRAE